MKQLDLKVMSSAEFSPTEKPSVCVCVCERERERERDMMSFLGHTKHSSSLTLLRTSADSPYAGPLLKLDMFRV